MLPRTFVVKELKRHREAVLLDRQRAMIPATQNAVAAEREKRQSYKRIREWTEQRDALKRQMHNLARQITSEYAQISQRGPAQRRQFIMKCARDGCRGFLNEQYTCSVCDGATCPHCHVFKEAEHECNEEDVATVALLRRDSKRCPNCSTWIHRYEGCAQMFCTNPECHTLFDYRTLRILGEMDHVHNPHYTEFLAQQRTQHQPAREAGDIPCGGMPHVEELYAALSSAMLHNVSPDAWGFPAVPTAQPSMPRFRLPLHRLHNVREHSSIRDVILRTVIASHRMVAHVEHVTMEQYRIRVDEPELEEMRVHFCLGDFDEASWRTRLQRREKDRNKKYEIFLVLQMVVHACSDLFRQMVLAARRVSASSSSSFLPERSVESIYADVRSVLIHANLALCRVAVTFSCTVPYFEFKSSGTHIEHPNMLTTLTHPVAKIYLANASECSAATTDSGPSSSTVVVVE